MPKQITQPGADLRVLRDRELDAVAGASTNEATIFSMLTSAVNDVLKSIGDAMTTVARKG